ncbi:MULTISPECIES: hypothetical protein [Nocardia]|uniref:hypothetical protein n=1 Tax=Nocardia TaxID=1817 RepID=UPI001C4E52C7|nr:MULTISPECIES: hypothetical protein [Nocardia]
MSVYAPLASSALATVNDPPPLAGVAGSAGSANQVSAVTELGPESVPPGLHADH